MLHTESIEYQWEIPEFKTKEKKQIWYWVLGLVSLSIIGIAIYLENYLFAFLILIGGFSLFRMSQQEGVTMTITLSQKGVGVNEEFYPYEEMSAFWIRSNKEGEPILLLATQKPVTPVISIRIHSEIDIMEMRDFLLNFVEEHELKEPFTNRILDLLGL